MTSRGTIWRALAAAIVVGAAAAAPVAAQQAPARAPLVETELKDPWGHGFCEFSAGGFYPDYAARMGAQGEAVADCRLEPDDTLSDCKILAELPEGFHFRDALLRMAVTKALKAKLPAGTAARPERVRVRFVFTMNHPGLRPPESHEQPGSPAMLLTPGGRDFACPTEADPKARCGGHPLEWAERPSADQLAAALADLPADLPASYLRCTVGDDGRLGSCASTDTRANAGLSHLLPAFRAVAAKDGEPAAGRLVVLTFDWPMIRAVAP